RHAAGGVALVADLLVVHALEFARGLLDRALDHVAGHVGAEGLVHRAAQARVGRRITAAGARGHRDLADDLGEDLAPLRVLRVLAVLDVRPLGMACHGNALEPKGKDRNYRRRRQGGPRRAPRAGPRLATAAAPGSGPVRPAPIVSGRTAPSGGRRRPA